MKWAVDSSRQVSLAIWCYNSESYIYIMKFRFAFAHENIGVILLWVDGWQLPCVWFLSLMCHCHWAYSQGVALPFLIEPLMYGFVTYLLGYPDISVVVCCSCWFFSYTYMYNRTSSLLPCHCFSVAILSKSSFNLHLADGHLSLIASQWSQLCVTLEDRVRCHYKFYGGK